MTKPRFDTVNPPFSELPQRGISLVDRDCAMLDGHCDCPRKSEQYITGWWYQTLNCKKYGANQ